MSFLKQRLPSVRVFGTCRVHKPLKIGHKARKISVKNKRNYGYVQTTPEIIQQIRYVFDGTPVPDAVRPYVFADDYVETTPEPQAKDHDLTFIEVSSVKNQIVFDRPIQLNFLKNGFKTFFADLTRARRYWSLAKPDTLSERAAWLAELPEYRALSPEGQQVLANVWVKMMTKDDIAADLRRLSELLVPERTIIVSHVDALGADGQKLPARSQLIGWLTELAPLHGFSFYNPTPLVEQYGQEVAMENGGADTTHYTEHFEHILFEDLYNKFIKPS